MFHRVSYHTCKENKVVGLSMREGFVSDIKKKNLAAMDVLFVYIMVPFNKRKSAFKTMEWECCGKARHIVPLDSTLNSTASNKVMETHTRMNMSCSKARLACGYMLIGHNIRMDFAGLSSLNDD